MRFFVFIIASIILFSSFAEDERLESDIWVNGSSHFRGSDQASNQTVYFASWDPVLDQLRSAGKHSIAFQLDDQLDPLPQDQTTLPSLAAIASIASSQTRANYLSFLERYSRTNGFSYLVLPDTAGLSRYEKEVIVQANAGSPDFFILQDRLSYSLPDSKKDFIAKYADDPKILIASATDNFRRLRKWRSKFLTEDHQKFASDLAAARNRAYETVHELPTELQGRLFSSGTYAVDSANILPIKDKEIAYLGSNERLRRWLSNYAKVGTERKEGVVTIVDHRSNDHVPVLPGDLVLTHEKVRADVSQLVFPINLEGQEILIAKMVFGAAEVAGRNEAARYLADHQLMSYSEPSTEGMYVDFAKQLDSIGISAITNYATPGLQLAVVRNGSLVSQKAMGYYTYDSIKSVEAGTIYDLASLTKVMATLPAIALLIDRELIGLDDSVAQFLPEFVGSNKQGVTIRQLLSHHAGLKSYVPFWKMMMEGDRLDAFYYKTAEDEANDIRSYGFEPHPIMIDTLKSFLVKSGLNKHPNEYKYSDLGFMMLHLVVERVTRQPFDVFLEKEFYGPMGLENTTFNPVMKGIPYSDIAPTEYDQRFRNYQVWGEVHDRNAAVFGGVSGHAGLFSNATDLAKMMCMYLNNGFYDGRRYLSERILNEFNLRHFEGSRRGLGWDKKNLNEPSAMEGPGDRSFGHTGFTGTMVWADPEQELIFVFLSNRIYPDAKNQRLNDFKIRSSMQHALYQSIISN